MMLSQVSHCLSRVSFKNRHRPTSPVGSWTPSDPLQCCRMLSSRHGLTVDLGANSRLECSNIYLRRGGKKWLQFGRKGDDGRLEEIGANPIGTLRRNDRTTRGGDHKRTSSWDHFMSNQERR